MDEDVDLSVPFKVFEEPDFSYYDDDEGTYHSFFIDRMIIVTCYDGCIEDKIRMPLLIDDDGLAAFDYEEHEWLILEDEIQELYSDYLAEEALLGDKEG